MKYQSKRVIHIKYFRISMIFSFLLVLFQIIFLFISIFTPFPHIYLSLFCLLISLIFGTFYLQRLININDMNHETAQQISEDWYSAIALMAPMVSFILMEIFYIGITIDILILNKDIITWMEYILSYILFLFISCITYIPFDKKRKYVYRYISTKYEKDNYFYIW